ncbi:MAG: pteridine reductase [marine bacterium B5-7]|nr:MAG: pteridine reductase [marine bacterium B5-7]
MTADESIHNRVALVTGSARRIGAEIVRHLHNAGHRVLIHYGTSADAANYLAAELNTTRPGSACCIAADISDINTIDSLANQAIGQWGQLDVLVNNASKFHSTPLGDTTESQWDGLLDINLKAPYFLTQALAIELKRCKGAVVNITDIYADRPLADHIPYTITKAGLVNMTRALAQALAPDVRVNGIAPGAILWPETNLNDAARQRLLARVPLNRTGSTADIASTVLFLVQPDSYITGQIINVDGGRTCVP